MTIKMTATMLTVNGKETIGDWSHNRKNFAAMLKAKLFQNG